MRIILVTLFALGLCSQCTLQSEHNNEIIIQFLNEQFSTMKDHRIYVPPPPPSVNDSSYYEGKLKPDSVIKKLEPLKFYINDSIRYDMAFKPNKDFPVGFDFIQEISTYSKQAVYIDISFLSSKVKSEFVLQRIRSSEVKNTISQARYDDNYGGIISLHNLYFSENREKAYFEVHFFKGSLNAGTYGVYAELENGKWKYHSKLLSIS